MMTPQTEPIISRRALLQLLGLSTASFAATPLLSGCAVDPVTGSSQFMIMSEQEEIALDTKQSPYQFSTDYGAIQDDALNRYINKVGQHLAVNSHRPHMPFSFRGVNAAYINAYAFPGGSIAATRGILVELENEAELAALLGHEIGHVCARHTAEQSSKGMLANILVAGASIATSAAGYGSAASLVQDLGGLSAGALLASYSRDNEREADALGMDYMTRTGYNPKGMVGLMELLQANSKHKPSAIELMFATHPMSDERFATAQKAAQSIPPEEQNYPFHRERYMDNTAALRRLKPMITALQNGSAAMGKKNYTAAKQEFDKALQNSPNDYAALLMMAKCQFAMKKTDKAEHYAGKAALVYPREAQAHIVTGVIAIQNRNYDRALAHLKQYDTLLPGNVEVTFYKGYALEGMNKRKQAAGEYRTYLQQVRQGRQAQHAYGRLKEWGYLN